MQTILSKSLNETQDFANNYLKSLSPKGDEATVLGLYGNLGSGKTAFTKCLANVLGIEENITSPTFVIMKIYETKNDCFKRLIHIDAYRLKDEKELQIIGFEELISNKNNLIVIEWPENVMKILPQDHNRLYCNFVDEITRQYEVK